MFKSAIGAAAFAAMMMGTTSAQAVCTQSGQIVERVIAYSSNICYMYLRPRTALTNSVYHWARSSNDKICDLAGDAKTTRTEVNVSGNAASCPTAGASRYMGDARYIYLLN